MIRGDEPEVGGQTLHAPARARQAAAVPGVRANLYMGGFKPSGGEHVLHQLVTNAHHPSRGEALSVLQSQKTRALAGPRTELRHSRTPHTRGGTVDHQAQLIRTRTKHLHGDVAPGIHGKPGPIPLCKGETGLGCLPETGGVHVIPEPIKDPQHEVVALHQ